MKSSPQEQWLLHVDQIRSNQIKSNFIYTPYFIPRGNTMRFTELLRVQCQRTLGIYWVCILRACHILYSGYDYGVIYRLVK